MSALLFSFGRRLRIWSLWRVLAVGIVVFSRCDATGHDLFTAYIQHRVQASLGADHLDVTVDLTFFEEWSARERRQMDADGDGKITGAEMRSYLKRLAPVLSQQVRLRVTENELLLTPLYEPEADLLGSDKAGPAHHRLKLVFFASTPRNLRAGDVIAIEDGLWSDAKALITFHAEGRDGCLVEAEKQEPTSASRRPGEVRTFKLKCLRPPPAAEMSARPSP